MKNLFKIGVLFSILAMTWAASTGKIHPDLIRSLKLKPLVNVFVSFNDGTKEVLDELALTSFANRGEKATAVYSALSAHASLTQRNVLELLKSPRFFATAVHSFWITNQVYIKRAERSLIDVLANMEEVGEISEEEIIQLDEPEADKTDAPVGVTANEWGVDMIKAPDAWEFAGSQGEGAVIGIIDTGARYTHEAIKHSYKDDDFSWYNPLSANSQFPVDGNGHGTHCTGTIAGSLGIGVAPGAKWISCKGLSDFGSGASSDLIKCAEFMTCPHKWNNPQDRDCSKVPDAVSNSWGGAGGRDVYDDMIRVWHSVDIIPVISLGNNGPICSSSGHPGDSRSGVLGVGATTNTDAIASFSSRGPSNWNEQKPEIVAPGNNVRSAYYQSDTSYTSLSGTSMACPHVAGLVALVRARNPKIKYAQLSHILQSSADTNLFTTGETCRDVPDTQFPNYKFGHGRINALKALRATAKA